jgi:hypothetical protein
MAAPHIRENARANQPEENRASRQDTGIGEHCDNGMTLGLAPFGTRRYAVEESSAWSLCASCGQVKVLA